MIYIDEQRSVANGCVPYLCGFCNVCEFSLSDVLIEEVGSSIDHVQVKLSIVIVVSEN